MMQYGLTDQAHFDLHEIWNFIAADKVSAADDMIDSFVSKIRMLASHPEAGRVRPDLGKDIRVFPVGQYIIVYAVSEDSLTIIRILSGFRDIAAQFD